MPSGGGTPPRLPVIPDKRALHSCPVVGSLWPLGMHEVLPGARHGDNGTNLTEAKIRSVGGVATPCKLEVAVDIGGIAKFPMESLEQDLRNVDFAATYTPFQTKPDAAPVRLIVRRVKPTPGSQLALFARYSYHAFITDRDGETLELEADHRRHAEVENAIRDLKYGMWLAVQVMAHNLARWTARIGLGEADRDHQDPQAAGLRSGGTDHPLGAPPHFASPPALALGNPVQSRLGPAASHSVPGLTASLQLTQRPRNLAPPRSRESPAAYPLHPAHRNSRIGP